MAQGRLTGRSSALVATVLALLGAGLAAEVLATSLAVPLRIADLAVGAAFALGALRPSLDAATRGLALLVAAAWFAGTLASAGTDHATLQDLGTAVVLAYRGPVLHLLLRPPGRWHGWLLVALAAMGYVAALSGSDAGAWLTVAVALAAACASRRRAPVAVPVAIVWGLAAAGVSGPTTLLLANDAALLVVAAALLWIPEAERRRSDVLQTLLVDLGRPGAAAGPVSEQVGRALGDPGLRVLFRMQGLGWIDESGAPTVDPWSDGELVTRAPLPSGAEVALVHGEGAMVDPRLAAAAAGAVAVAADSARLDAEARVQAEAVRASRERLLEVVDGERAALERRLRDGALWRLARVRELLAGSAATTAELDDEVEAAGAEIVRLARGLSPGSLARDGLSGALQRLADGTPLAVEVELVGPVDDLPPDRTALAYFVASESLTNAVRHADAGRVVVGVAVTGGSLTVAVSDDGRGGARLDGTRGLRGLADRVAVAGGTLTVSSPQGGGTTILAAVPLASRTEG